MNDIGWVIKKKDSYLDCENETWVALKRATIFPSRKRAKDVLLDEQGEEVVKIEIREVV